MGSHVPFQRSEGLCQRRRQAEERSRQQAFKRRLATAVMTEGPGASAPAARSRRIFSVTGGQAAAAAEAAATTALGLARAGLLPRHMQCVAPRWPA